MSSITTILEKVEDIISRLPKNLRCSHGEKSCKNCTNLGVYAIECGYYWAERACHYCDDYDNWSYIGDWKNELLNKIELE
jgi:hypothetical protein